MHRHRQLKRTLLFLLVLFIVIFLNLPVIVTVLNSFKATTAILSETNIIPSQPTLENYERVSQQTPYWTWFKNSMIVTGGATLLCILSATLAGYALSRFRLVLLTVYSRSLLMLQTFPLILALIPLFILFRDLKLVNTYLGPILIYAVAQLPFATWMFKSFFDAIPKELEEAAVIDGCSQIKAFRLIVLPLSGPAIAAVTIFAFLFVYNEFFIANIFLRKEELMTIPVGIQMFIQQFGADWGSLMAAATLAMLPTLIFFMFVEKYIVHLAVGGAVKG
ncbi:MAG: carbohydrate ABC transporter permease [Anaerolineae bacterium]|nr:carbohydrate ABC transporter permease [Anaerolineae bacterium]